MPSPLRLAFIGIDHPHGAGWRESLQLLAPEIEIVALVPAFDGGVASLEERYARLPRFETVEALLEFGEFDAAMICLPNRDTPAACVALAHARKHLAVEKPGARSVGEFQPVVDAVRESGVAFQAGYLWRYDVLSNRLREMVADGRFGKLISIEMSMVTSDLNRRGPGHYLFDRELSGSGFFSWLGCHWLDLLPYVVQQKIVGVTARIGVFGDVPTSVEDGGTIILELEGGGIATLIGGYWLPRWVTESGWTMRGSQRWLKWDPSRPGTGGALVIHGPQPQFHAMEETFSLPPDTTPGYGGPRTQHLFRDWLTEVRGEGKICRNDVTSAMQFLQLLEAIERSSDERRRVELSY